MTRKQRQAHAVYNEPRNQASFDALLEEEDSEGLQQRGSKPKKASTRKPERPFHFQLRSQMAAAAGSPGSSQGAAAGSSTGAGRALKDLQAMFAGSMDPSLVEDVFAGCQRSFPAALDALLAVVGAGGAEGATVSGTAGASTSSAASRAESNQASTSYPSYPMAAEDGPPCCWDQLPNDVKQAVLQLLPLKEVARLAQTCSEFSQRTRVMRAAVRHLALQPGLSYKATVGMVSGHSGAHTLSLARFTKQQRTAVSFEEAEAALFTALVAAAQGYGGGAGRMQPLRRLEARSLAGMTDRVLAEALRGLPHLRALDLSGCESLSNKSLYALAKQVAEPWEGASTSGAMDDSEAQGHASFQGNEDEWEEGWQQLLDDDAAAGDADAGDGYAGAGSDGAGGGAASNASQQHGQEGEQWREVSGAGSGPSSSTAAAAAAVPVVDTADAPGNADAAGSAGANDGDAAVGEGIPFGANRAIRYPVSANVAALMEQQLAALALSGSAAATSSSTAPAAAGPADRQAVAAPAFAAAQANAGGGVHTLLLSGNGRYQDDGLRALLSGVATRTSLQSLDVSRCGGISEAGLQLPPLGVLRELKASRCKSITSLTLQLPASHPLKTLDLSCCHFLRELTLAVPQLQTLNLSACRTLYRLRVRCPRLLTLIAPQCAALHSFYDDAWQCPQLRSLNLFGCRRVSGAQLEAVLGAMTALRSLNLNGCWEVPRLHLENNLLLERLDVSGCNMLGSLTSASPCLIELQAASCTRLVQLSLQLGQLRRVMLNNCTRLSQVQLNTQPQQPQQQRQQQVSGSKGAGGEDGGSGRQKQGSGAALEHELSLLGCTALPDAARAQLKALVAAERQ